MSVEVIDPVIEQDIDEAIKDLIGDNHNLIVHNDDHNTFEWVITLLMKYVGHTSHQAEQCAMIIHNRGKCSVKSGDMEELKPIKDSLIEGGLSATIE